MARRRDERVKKAIETLTQLRRAYHLKFSMFVWWGSQYEVQNVKRLFSKESNLPGAVFESKLSKLNLRVSYESLSQCSQFIILQLDWATVLMVYRLNESALNYDKVWSVTIELYKTFLYKHSKKNHSRRCSTSPFTSFGCLKRKGILSKDEPSRTRIQVHVRLRVVDWGENYWNDLLADANYCSLSYNDTVSLTLGALLMA